MGDKTNILYHAPPPYVLSSLSPSPPTYFTIYMDFPFWSYAH